MQDAKRKNKILTGLVITISLLLLALVMVTCYQLYFRNMARDSDQASLKKVVNETSSRTSVPKIDHKNSKTSLPQFPLGFGH